MLKTQEVVNFVNNKLNEIGTQDDYSFDIHSNIGENSNNGALNGILYVNQASTMPIPDYVENTYNFVVEIIIPSARANHHFEKVQNIVESFVDAYDGKEQVFGNGKGLLNITPGKPENFNVGYNSGENVPLYFSVSVLYTEDAETSGDGHWLLNGLEIPYLNDDVLLDKEGNVNKIYGKKSAEVFLTGQTKFFKFRFPRRKDELGNMIQQDLLEGDFDKQYTLTYYDGEVYTEEEPYETTVSIFRSGNKNGQRGKVKIFDITFAEVDNGQKTTKYYIALIDNQFDNQAEDTRWFDPIKVGGVITKTAQQVQQEYYEDKIEDGCDWEQIKAPNLNLLDISSQIYPNNNNYELFDLVNKNYAIIKVEKGSYIDDEFVVSETNYFYYYVNNAQIGQNNQVLFDLKMDTLQTYMFNPELQFSDCYIEKANLNRWVEVDENTVAFNGQITSDLFEREGLQNVAKRLTKRTKTKMINETIGEWLNNNVEGWLYCYLDPYKELDDKKANYVVHKMGYTNQTTKQVISQLTNEATPVNFCVLAVPIYKKYNIYHKKVKCDVFIQDPEHPMEVLEYLVELSVDSLKDFLNMNDGYSYVFGIKVSCVPPSAFRQSGINEDGDLYALVNNAEYITTSEESWVYGETVHKAKGCLVCQTTWTSKQPDGYLRLLTTEYEIAEDLSFLKTDITGTENNPAIKNVEYNPKLLSSDYKDLKICNYADEGFSYDVQKLNKKAFKLEISEPMTTEITRAYSRIAEEYLDGVYIEETNKNYTGNVSNVDAGLPQITSYYQNAMAFQKNYYQQNEYNRNMSFLQNVGTGLGGAFLGGLLGGPIGSGVAVGGALTSWNTILNDIKSRANEAFTVDNMKASPSSIKNAGGSIFLHEDTDNIGVFIEEWDVLPHEKEMANDLMVKYGFTLNKFGNLRDYCIIRHYFNFVKAQISSIYGIPMSNVARANIRERFASGVRFWKSDNIDYDYENYEEWLNTDYHSYESWLEAQQ